jgi:hypothetical protein
MRLIDDCFAHSRDPFADPLLHAAMIENLLWRDLCRLRIDGGAEAFHGVLEDWLTELRLGMLREGDAVDEGYRLKVLEIAARRLRERIHAMARQSGEDRPAGEDHVAADERSPVN